MKAIKFLSVALALITIAGCSEQSTRGDVDVRISDAACPLVFLTHPITPPHSYIDANGEFAGSEVELAKKIAAKMGRALKIESVAFHSIMPRLKAGTADFGISTITITEARKRDVDFSEPYAFGGSCFLYRKDSPKPRMSNLASMRVGVEADTIGDIYLCRHGGDPIRFVNLSDAVKSLENGVLDAIFYDAPALDTFVANSSGRFTVTTLKTRDCYGVAVDKRRPDVLAAVNEVIAEGGVQ